MRRKHDVHSAKLPKKVIVLNWAADQTSLIDSFADFSPPGTEVVFVGQEAHHIPNRRHAVKFREVCSAAQNPPCGWWFLKLHEAATEITCMCH